MTEKDTSKDPSDQFVDSVTEWERRYDSAANQFMGTEMFSAWMNQMQQSQLAMRRMQSDLSGQILKDLNIPTRDDVIRLGEALQKIDERLERIERSLDIGKVTHIGKAPARTRQPEFLDPESQEK